VRQHRCQSRAARWTHGRKVEPLARRHVIGRHAAPVEYVMPSSNRTSPEALDAPSPALSTPTTSNRAILASDGLAIRGRRIDPTVLQVCDRVLESSQVG
jgi:hypothetical protein